MHCHYKVSSYAPAHYVHPPLNVPRSALILASLAKKYLQKYKSALKPDKVNMPLPFRG